MTLPNEFTVYGSEETLKPLILQLLAQYYDTDAGEATGGGSPIRLPIYVKGHIYIKLMFKGFIANTKADHRVEKTFRLMKDDPRTITTERLTALATLVHSKFNNFTFTTGHDAYTYNHPEVGFSRIWGFFNTEVDARRLFEQMLDIVATAPEWQRLTRSTVVQPGDRFQEPPEKELQANVNVRTDRERPIATVHFTKALIKFPHIRKELELVNGFGVNPLLMKEIQSYADVA